MMKYIKDYAIKFMLAGDTVPAGLYDIHHYFRVYDPIKFNFYKEEDDSLIATSQNFQYGSIITSGKTAKELEENIQDAILTSFEIPISYKKEAGVHKVGSREGEYVFA